MTEKIIELCSASKTPVRRAHWHGWNLSLLPDQMDEKFGKENTVILDGISFSTKISCGGVFMQDHDEHGNVRPIRIDNNGDVVVMR